jgi:hypothetical protein
VFVLFTIIIIIIIIIIVIVVVNNGFVGPWRHFQFLDPVQIR